MKYSDIKELIDKNAPDKGYALVYTRKCLIFKEYSDKESVEGIIDGDGEEILEVHLFNCEKEYRILSSKSSRYPNGFVAHTAEFSNAKEDVYIQDIYLDLKKENVGDIKTDKIKVINHIAYTAEGMAYIDDYRLCID